MAQGSGSHSQLTQAMTHSPYWRPASHPILSRRQALGLGATGLGALALSACGASAATPIDAPASIGATGAAMPSEIVFSNWPMYIDEGGDGSPSTLEQFTASTGLDVIYNEDISDGADFLAKVIYDLEAGRGIGRDLVVLSEETARYFIELGYAAPLDYSLIPNAVNLLPTLQNIAFDPNREFTMPWQGGFTGLGWNTDLLEEHLGTRTMTSLDQFFDPRLAGRVSILSETLDTMGLLLLWQGDDATDFTDAQFDTALATLQKYVDNGHIRQVTGNDYIAGLDSGDLIASMGWSGDVLALGDRFDFALPQTGGIVWADCMIIPQGAANPVGANMLINHYYDPQVAATLAASINYLCPVLGAQEAMRSIDPALADNQWIFPTDELLANAHFTAPVSVARQEQLDRAFDAVTNA